MRAIRLIVSLLAVVFIAGCAHQPPALTWNDRSVFPRGQSVASLNSVAGSPFNTPEERAKAIFTLFSANVKPGFTAEKIHSVLRETNWMNQAYLYRITALGGWLPVELEETVFCLLLFREAEPINPWHIVFRISGDSAGDYSQQEADAFLRGDTTLPRSPRLVEFALCFPVRSEYHGRTERYGPKGIHVYGQP